MADCGTRILSENYGDFIIDYTTITQIPNVVSDLCYNIVYGTVAVGYERLSTLPKNIFQSYSYSVFPHCYGLMDITSIDSTGISRLRGIPSLNLKGKGILIGIVDTGIDYTHEAFRNEDGTTRILSIWDQTIQSDRVVEGFYYGTEYDESQINEALLSTDPLSIVPSMDDNGHGTFLAGIAAGNINPAKEFSGVAPESKIIVVKLKQAKKFIRDYFFIPEGATCYSESSPTGEYIPEIPARIGTTRELKFLFESSEVFIDYELIETQTGDQLILMRFKNPSEGIWKFRVYSKSSSRPSFHIWLPINEFLDDETYFTEPDPNFTLTSPGNTIATIVTTAYSSTNESIYIYASRGFTRTNNISPTFAAPGVNLIGPTFNNGYILASGSSVAAAFTTGVVAMILEWSASSYEPVYKTVEIKNILILGAERDPNLSYPNPVWGYGILDVYNSFLILRGR